MRSSNPKLVETDRLSARIEMQSQEAVALINRNQNHQSNRKTNKTKI